MEGQNEFQDNRPRKYVSTGPAPKSGGGRFGIGMVLGLIIGILMTVIVVGIFFAAGSSVSLPAGGKTGS